MIKGKQIPIATKLSERLDRINREIQALGAEAWEAGLGSITEESVFQARALLSKASISLHREATATYLAARRGEEIPK